MRGNKKTEHHPLQASLAGTLSWFRQWAMSRAVPGSRKDQGRSLLGWIQFGFTPFSLVAIGYFAWTTRDLLRTVLANAVPQYLLLAVGTWAMVHFLTMPTFSLVVLRGCGVRVTYLRALTIYANRLPARYLPGGFWQTVIRVVDFHRDAVPRAPLVAFAVLQETVAVSLAFLVGGGIVFLSHGWTGWGVVAAVGVFAGAVALPLLPVAVNALILRRQTHISLGAYLQGVLLFCLHWTIASAAFNFYLNGFPQTFGESSSLDLAGFYLFSWAIGYIFVFAPQGIGVFEAVAGSLLEGSLPLGTLVAVMAGFRAVILMADLLVWSAVKAAGAWLGGASPPQTGVRIARPLQPARTRRRPWRGARGSGEFFLLGRRNRHSAGAAGRFRSRR